MGWVSGSVRRGALSLAALVAAALVPAAAAGQTSKKVVAVLPFQSPNDHLHAKMGHNAQPTFITELVKSGKLRVVDEKRLGGALKRFKQEESGYFDNTKVREIGRFLKADYVVSGQVSWAGDAYTMTVHVTNVETLELEMADDLDFRDASKFRLAVRASAKKIAAMISGSEPVKEGKHEAFMNLDARHFYDTAEACIAALRGLDAWRYEGEIDEEGDGKRVHVKLRYGRPKPGTPLQIFEEGVGENDKAIGVLYVVEPDQAGAGFVAKWQAEQDPGKKKRGGFELGSRVSNAGYQYRIAVGLIEDEAEDNEKLVEMFTDKLLDSLEESELFLPRKIAGDAGLGRGGRRKQALAQLFQQGIDFVIEGKFIGSPGSRRADFKVISAMTGEVWATLKFETRI